MYSSVGLLASAALSLAFVLSGQKILDPDTF